MAKIQTMTRIVRAVVLTALAASFSAADASAQVRRSRFSTELSTVREVHLETHRLIETARHCGLVTEDLDKPARMPLATSRLKLTPSAPDFVVVSANVVKHNEVCAVSIEVMLLRWSQDFGVPVTVWSRNALIVGGTDGLNTRVSESVGTLTKELISDWLDVKR